MKPEHHGKCYETAIEGRTFVICTEPERDDVSGKFSGRWRAWSFFSYDRSLNIYPASKEPKSVKVQESIAGESADSEDDARRLVESTLHRVIQTKCLDGTGFYSPPGGFVYPQEVPDSD